MSDVCCFLPTDPGMLYFLTVVGMEASKCNCLHLEGECTQICKICQDITVMTLFFWAKSLKRRLSLCKDTEERGSKSNVISVTLSWVVV